VGGQIYDGAAFAHIMTDTFWKSDLRYDGNTAHPPE
jgi:hypothetical protein